MLIDIASEFKSRLSGRDGGKTFREKFLSGSQSIILDFTCVTHISPSFANTAFAFLSSEQMGRISFVNLTRIQQAIIDYELECGPSN